MKLRDNPIFRTSIPARHRYAPWALAIVSVGTLVGLCALFSNLMDTALHRDGAVAWHTIASLFAGVVLMTILPVVLLSPILVSTGIAQRRKSGIFDAERLSAMHPSDIALGYVLGPLALPALVLAVAGGLGFYVDGYVGLYTEGWSAGPFTTRWGSDGSMLPSLALLAVLTLSAWVLAAVASAWVTVVATRPYQGVAASMALVAGAFFVVGPHVERALTRGPDRLLAAAPVVLSCLLVGIGLAWVGLLRAIRRPPALRTQRSALQRGLTRPLGATSTAKRHKRKPLPSPFPWNNPVVQSAWQKLGRLTCWVTALAVVYVVVTVNGAQTTGTEAMGYFAESRLSPVLTGLWCQGQWFLASAAAAHLFYLLATQRQSGVLDALRLSPLSRRDLLLGYCVAAALPALGAMLVIALGFAVFSVLDPYADTSLSAMLSVMVNTWLANGTMLLLIGWLGLNVRHQARATLSMLAAGLLFQVWLIPNYVESSYQLSTFVRGQAPFGDALSFTTPFTVGVLAQLVVLGVIWREGTRERAQTLGVPLMRKRAGLITVLSLVVLQCGMYSGLPLTYRLRELPWVVLAGLLLVLVLAVAVSPSADTLASRLKRTRGPLPWHQTGTALAALCTSIVVLPAAVTLTPHVYSVGMAVAWAIGVVLAVTLCVALFELARLEPSKSLPAPAAVLVLVVILSIGGPWVLALTGVPDTERWALGWGILPTLFVDIASWSRSPQYFAFERVNVTPTPILWAFTALHAVLLAIAIGLQRSALQRRWKQLADRIPGR